MPKVTLPPIGNPENSSFVTELNDALATLANEFDLVVYRDGTLNLTADLDANSKRIFNLPFPVNPTEPMRYGDVADFQGTPGQDGEDALPPNFTFAINTGAAGTNATLDITGTYPDQLLTFTIPRGLPGESGALSDGTYGDIVVSGAGTVLSIGADTVGFTELAPLASAGLMGATAAGEPSVLSFATVKSQMSLNNVDNTSDANKPISTATQTALNAKANTSDLSNYAPALAGVVTISTNTTLSDATHLNKFLKLSGSTTRTITLNSTPSAGFTCIGANRASVSFTLSAASGIYKNGATATTTSATIAVGGQFSLIHEGSGVWSITGTGIS